MATNDDEWLAPYQSSSTPPKAANLVYAGSAGGGQVIQAVNYYNMAQILKDLSAHNHVFYDDYTTVCDCQCQCNCSRGTL
jgi:hypothetical protein